MYFFYLLFTLFSFVLVGIIRPFQSHSLWISHQLTPTSLLVGAFWGLYILWLQLISTCTFASLLVICWLRLLCYFLLCTWSVCWYTVTLFLAYITYFGGFVVTLIRIINSIAGSSVHISLCCFVCSYLWHKFFFSAERGDENRNKRKEINQHL